MEVIKDKASVEQIMTSVLAEGSRYPEGTDVHTLAKAYFDLRRERGKADAVNAGLMVLVEAVINWHKTFNQNHDEPTAEEALLAVALEKYMGI